MDRNSIIEIIYEVIGEMNQQYEDLELSKTEDTGLFGEHGTLDSLQLVNFVVNLEQRIHAKGNTEIVLADEKAMSQRNSPFLSVRALADFACSQSGE